METKKTECCGKQKGCAAVDEVDTADCSHKDSSGDCCGDETKCDTSKSACCESSESGVGTKWSCVSRIP